MVRTTAVAALLVIFPGFAFAQEAGTHTVVPGNTLWGIAQQYLGNPYQWPLIYEANRDRIENPHRIAPGQVVRIPGGPATAFQISIEPGPAGDAPLPTVLQQADPVFEQVPPGRTVFYRGPLRGVVGTVAGPALWDVPAEGFYSAPWLIPLGTIPERTGTVLAFDTDPRVADPSTSARPFDRLQVAVEGPLPSVGTRLQVFRVDSDAPEVGHVVTPTGILVVEALAQDGVVASVKTQFGRILLGDLVRPLPPFTPVTVDALIDATTGREANVLSYDSDREVQSRGAYAFLDVGSVDGVRIGDEYVVLGGDAGSWPGHVEGRVKIVAVLQDVSTARIVHLETPVFVAGVRLRPDRRVR